MAFLASTLMLVSFLFGLSFSFETVKSDRQNECHPFSHCNVEGFDSNGNRKHSYTAIEHWKYKLNRLNQRYNTRPTTTKPQHYYRKCCDTQDIMLLAICVCIFLLICFVLVPYWLHYKCGLPAPNTGSTIATDDAQDRWTRTQVASVPSEWARPQVASVPNELIDPPPAYPHDNSRILENVPSAPYLSYEEVNGIMSDDPPSYYEVVASS